MTPSHAARAVLPCLLAVAAAAQGRTWIVDAANGPGTDFTDIPPAVAAAADGDTLLVRAGSYEGFTTGKALTVLGRGRVDITSFNFLQPAVVEITGLPAGRQLVLRGVVISSLFATYALRLAGNDGRVLLEDVEVTTPTVFSGSGLFACAVAGCREAVFNRCRVFGFPAMLVLGSTVALTSSRVKGGDHCGSIRCIAVGYGLSANDSTVLLAHTDVLGGNGSIFSPFSGPQGAVITQGSRLLVTGDGNTRIVAGALAGAPPLAGIQTTGGSVDLDPTVVVLGSQGGPDVGGTATVVRRRIAATVAAGAPPGGTVQAEITSPNGDLLGLFVGLPGDPVPLPTGLVFVDPRALALVLLAVQGPTERTAVSLPVPMSAALAGQALTLQTSVLYAANQRLELTNPAAIVLD